MSDEEQEEEGKWFRSLGQDGMDVPSSMEEGSEVLWRGMDLHGSPTVESGGEGEERDGMDVPPAEKGEGEEIGAPTVERGGAWPRRI
jgi:hypothetical protein